MEECLDCFIIACQACPWVSSREEIVAFLDGTLTACPKCGWAPGKPVLHDLTVSYPDALLPNFPNTWIDKDE
jgi:hypothetical protein